MKIAAGFRITMCGDDSGIRVRRWDDGLRTYSI
jgi:hypothetical protein